METNLLPWIVSGQPCPGDLTLDLLNTIEHNALRITLRFWAFDPAIDNYVLNTQVVNLFGCIDVSIFI